MTTTAKAILQQMRDLKETFEKKHAGTPEAAVLCYALDNFLRIEKTILYTEQLIMRDAFIQGTIFDSQNNIEGKITTVSAAMTEFDLWYTTKYTE